MGRGGGRNNGAAGAVPPPPSIPRHHDRPSLPDAGPLDSHHLHAERTSPQASGQSGRRTTPASACRASIPQRSFSSGLPSDRRDRGGWSDGRCTAGNVRSSPPEAATERAARGVKPACLRKTPAEQACSGDRDAAEGDEADTWPALTSGSPSTAKRRRISSVTIWNCFVSCSSCTCVQSALVLSHSAVVTSDGRRNHGAVSELVLTSAISHGRERRKA